MPHAWRGVTLTEQREKTASERIIDRLLWAANAALASSNCSGGGGTRGFSHSKSPRSRTGTSIEGSGSCSVARHPSEGPQQDGSEGAVG